MWGNSLSVGDNGSLTRASAMASVPPPPKPTGSCSELLQRNIPAGDFGFLGIVFFASNSHRSAHGLLNLEGMSGGLGAELLRNRISNVLRALVVGEAIAREVHGRSNIAVRPRTVKAADISQDGDNSLIFERLYGFLLRTHIPSLARHTRSGTRRNTPRQPYAYSCQADCP